MKMLKVYLLSIVVIVGFFACSDDDGFGALGFDGQENVTIEVHRDTADSYNISLPITSEKGLAKVSLVDDATNKVLDEKVSFANMNTYTYQYSLDLTPYTVNSAIMLTLNIEDVDGQKMTQKVTVNVKKFSELDVRFAYEGTIVSLFEDCNLKVTVLRGMIPLKEVQVYVGTTLSETYDLSLDPVQSKYELNVAVKGLQMGENNIKIVVVDAKEQEFEREATVRRDLSKGFADMNRIQLPNNPKVMFNQPKADGADDNFPDDGRLYRVNVGATVVGDNMEYNYIDFEYAGDVVSKMTFSTLEEDGWTFDITQKEEVVYNYVYNADNEVIKVTKATLDSGEEDYITDVVYELGNIKSYKLNNKVIHANYIEKDGEMIRVDYLDAGMQGYTYNLNNRNNNNPLYIAHIPALVPGDYQGFELNVLYNRYFFDTLNDGSTTKYTYTIGQIVDEGWASTQEITWQEDGAEKKMKYTYKK